eukprot:7184661-Pyramimonas_sp.AAC.1
MNAVRLHNSTPRQQLSHEHKYAGLRRGASQHMVRNKYAPAVYTPAHRELSVIDALPAPERWVGQANWQAEIVAKTALRLHPQPSAAEVEAVNNAVEHLQTVARLAAGILPLFPRVQHQRPPTRERP